MLRACMADSGLSAFILPSTDPHQSEYIAEHWQSRAYFSGFSGSAGTLVVTDSSAGLWTDSRYYLQAEQELEGSGIHLFRSQEAEVETTSQWLGRVLPKGSHVGIDGWLITQKEKSAKEKELEKQGLTLRLDVNPVEKAWTDRPALPKSPVVEHPLEFAGKARAIKLSEIRAKMHQMDAKHHLICALDDQAWVLNLRGSDVEFNPVFYAYLMVSHEGCTLFSDPEKFGPALRESLATDGVKIEPINKLLDHCRALDGNVWVDPAATSFAVHEALKDSGDVLHHPGVVGLAKALKNPVEVALLRKTMVKDGVALVKLFRWIEDNMAIGITENDVAEQIQVFRGQQAEYMGESFAAIAGFRGNGAIVHYRPGEDALMLEENGIFLLDCGGQYRDGTTDITRTVTFGMPTDEQKENFTLVLKGHIALATAKFPEGTGGYQLDVLARQPLWSRGLNYGHGTGHGVGFFLNVHEGPQSIRHGHNERSANPMVAGMVTSNEPGYYKTGQYGIRIENLMLCTIEDQTSYGTFLGFETLTLFPIDLELVSSELLTEAERSWLNSYHRKVLEALSPMLNAEEGKWLAYRCRPI